MIFQRQLIFLYVELYKVEIGRNKLYRIYKDKNNDNIIDVKKQHVSALIIEDKK